MVSYDKLWHLLLDKGLNKGDLCKETGISSSTMAKLGKNEIVSLGRYSRFQILKIRGI